MYGLSEAAKKLTPYRTLLNLGTIMLSHWKRNWVSRSSPDCVTTVVLIIIGWRSVLAHARMLRPRQHDQVPADSR